MHQTTDQQQQAADVQHPVLRAVHLHKKQQQQADGQVFHGIAVYTDSALQLAETAVAICDAILHPQTNHIERELHQQQRTQNRIKRAYHRNSV